MSGCDSRSPLLHIKLLINEFLSDYKPYSMPTQKDKEWYWLDLVMPSSKGFSSGKAIGYFEKGIKSGDINYIAAVYNACVMKASGRRSLRVKSLYRCARSTAVRSG